MRQVFLTYFIFLTLLTFGQQNTTDWFRASRDQQDPVLVAHRGGSDTILPENSLAIMRFLSKKMNGGVAAIEIDIRASQEGKLLLMHDDTLSRTTSGKGYIAQASDEYLNSLFLKNQHGMLTNERIPTFEEILIFAKQHKMLLMLDIKGPLIDQVAKTVKNKNMERQCLILTFSPQRTDEAIAATQEAFVSALVKNKDDFERLQRHSSQFYRMAAYVSSDIDPTLLNALKSAGLTILTDVLETNNIPFAPHPEAHYLSIISQLKPNILVTDFPLHAGKISLDE